MFGRTTTYTTYANSRNDNDDVIVAIVTNNLTRVRSLINRNNVNTIIDSKNNYTALHYAVTLPNNDITKYILEMGGDPKIKQTEGYDAFELALRSGKKFIFEYYKQLQQVKIDDLETDNTKLALRVDELKRTNQYLNESADDFNKKINALHKVIEVKDKEINKLKKDLDESEKAFTNLLKKQKK
jgi:ankyrin repeat protein